MFWVFYVYILLWLVDELSNQLTEKQLTVLSHLLRKYVKNSQVSDVNVFCSVVSDSELLKQNTTFEDVTLSFGKIMFLFSAVDCVSTSSAGRLHQKPFSTF